MDESPHDRIWTKIIFWDDRVIYERVGATLPWVSFFSTKRDAEIKREIETWYSIQKSSETQQDITQGRRN